MTSNTETPPTPGPSSTATQDPSSTAQAENKPEQERTTGQIIKPWYQAPVLGQVGKVGKGVLSCAGNLMNIFGAVLTAASGENQSQGIIGAVFALGGSVVSLAVEVAKLAKELY